MDNDSISALESDNRVDTSADTIGSFIADWVQIKYFYSEAASLAQELCETLLASNAIRAIVTHRVKQGHRLEAKLRERVRKQGREYRSAKEIRDDVVDLAGVRIALYFPSDREKIDKIIHDAFTEVKHKSFPEGEDRRLSDTMTIGTEPSPDFQQRFHGYFADHYCVRMKVENLATKKLRDDFQKTSPMIEIQVASVLMHAWAEIDHDLVYKTLTGGPASQQELRLLDATNGLVHTGEVLLQQLQTAMDDRVAYQNKKFSEQYELLSFLRGQIKNAKGSMEHLDILLLVLKMTGMDSPRKLGETLKGFVIPPKSTGPIALVILEHILGSLGEEQRRTNNLYLRAKSIRFTELEIDKTNPKCYSTTVETCDKMLNQRDILEMTVSVADVMRFPEKSILVVEGMPQKFRKFYALYNLAHFATVRPDKESKDGEKWLCEISLRELDPLWTWFETNSDVLFRVSLLLARLNVEEIDRELIKLRPSSGFQRLPSLFDPNTGSTSPGYMTPMSPEGFLSSPSFSPSQSRNEFDTESKTSRQSEKSIKPKRVTETEGLQKKKKKKHNKKQPLATIEPDEIEEEEEDTPIILPERTRRPYIDSTPKPEFQKSPKQQTRPSASSPIPERTIHRRSHSPKPLASASTPENILQQPTYFQRPSATASKPEDSLRQPTYFPRQWALASAPGNIIPPKDYIPRPPESASVPEDILPPKDYMRQSTSASALDKVPTQPMYRPSKSASEQKAYVEDGPSEESEFESSKPIEIARPVPKPMSPPRNRDRTTEVSQYQPMEPPQRDSMPGVPEVPEPPDLDITPEEVPRVHSKSMPERPRRRNSGRSQRNDYSRSQDPGRYTIPPRFEQLRRTAQGYSNDDRMRSEPAMYFQNQQPPIPPNGYPPPRIYLHPQNYNPDNGW